jgi:hypothetical protein
MTLTNHKTRARPKLTLKKRLLFGTIATLLSLPVVELISWSAVRFGLEDDLDNLRDMQTRLAISGGSKGSLNETIHPYLGWVTNPQVSPGTDLGGRHIPVNQFGFNDDEQGIPRRAADRLIIGVLGGSVAWQMTVLGESAFRETLKRNPAWRDKEIRVVRLAMPAYKQPQQVMALNYFLALGAQFDVNIDGYNEIALAAVDNHPAGVFAAYPRSWNLRTQDIADPRVYLASFRILTGRAARQQLAQKMCRSWFRRSPTANLLWKLRDGYWQNQLVDAALELSHHTNDRGKPFASTGPPQLYANQTEMFDHLRDLWKNCSLQIDHLCRGARTKYVHILQPNQYVAGSKPMGEQERSQAVHETQLNGQAIARGYSLLIRSGSELREQGIDFHDLTMLFANVEERIYADQFCHYNARGNELFARAVAEKVIDAFGVHE